MVRGTLIGAPGDLAHKTLAYPCVRWSFELADYLGEDHEGRMQFRPKDVTMTPLIGAGAGFQLSSFEVRLPDKHGKVTPIKGSATVRSPAEILQDTRRQIEEIRAAAPDVVQVFAGELARELAGLLGKRTAKLTRRDATKLQKKLANLQRRILPHHLALAALSGQLPPNIARYLILEGATSETLAASGVRNARRQDAFALLFSKMAKGLNESSVLLKQTAYEDVTGLRTALITHLAAPQHEIVLKPVLDHWYETGDYKKIVRYAGQYNAKASRFLFNRPVRYNQRSAIRLSEQYGYHAGLLQQQLRFLLALDHSARGEKRMYSDVEEKNIDSLLGSPRTHESIRALAQALDRHIRNALAHGVAEIDCDKHSCIFEDRNKRIELSFDELFDRTMLLTVTTLCLLGIEQRRQALWLRQRLDTLLGG